jgi:hypothetical protein
MAIRQYDRTNADEGTVLDGNPAPETNARRDVNETSNFAIVVN